MRICLRGCARAMCIPILTSATVKPALARRVPVVPGRPCPSRPSRRRVRRARRACRHRRPRRARRPRPAHGDPHSSREPPGPTDVAISAGTPRTPSSGFRDPEMSRMCRGPTVDSKNAGIHTRTPGRLWTLECLRSSILVRPSRLPHRTGDYLEGEPWLP